LVLPRITAPAARSPATTGASRPVTLSFNARLPAVVGNGPNKVAAEEVRIKLSELCYKSMACDSTEDKKHIDLSSEPLILVCAAGLVGSTARQQHPGLHAQRPRQQLRLGRPGGTANAHGLVDQGQRLVECGRLDAGQNEQLQRIGAARVGGSQRPGKPHPVVGIAQGRSRIDLQLMQKRLTLRHIGINRAGRQAGLSCHQGEPHDPQEAPPGRPEYT
jgi:hypothetical protein